MNLWHYSYAPLSIQFLKTYVEKELIYHIKQDSSLLGKEFISPEFIEGYFREKQCIGNQSTIKTIIYFKRIDLIRPSNLLIEIGKETPFINS